MGLKHFKNVAIACAPDNVGLAHELIGALRESEVMPFDFTLKALTVKSDGIPWPLFSEKLKNLIEKMLTGKEGLKWISCNICCGKETRTYYIPHFIEELDVLNKDKCFYSNNGGLIKPAYSSLKIKDYSIFPKPAMNDLWQITAAICISDKVKNALMKANISNIAYEAVSVY